jgi:hypothetical protein
MFLEKSTKSRSIEHGNLLALSESFTNSSLMDVLHFFQSDFEVATKICLRWIYSFFDIYNF